MMRYWNDAFQLTGPSILNLNTLPGKQMKHKLTHNFNIENKANENYNNKIKFFKSFFWLFLNFRHAKNLTCVKGLEAKEISGE